VWARLLTLLQARADAAGLIFWEVNVDSTICRASMLPVPAGAVLCRRNRRAE
jgi:hypothetical protein